MYFFVRVVQLYKQYPYLEYSLHTHKANCFVCQLFPQHDSKDAWVIGSQNAWDKIKSVGTKKKGKLTAHFGSASHKATLQQFAHFIDPKAHIDVRRDKGRRQEMIEIAEVERNREKP